MLEGARVVMWKELRELKKIKYAYYSTILMPIFFTSLMVSIQYLINFQAASSPPEDLGPWKDTIPKGMTPSQGIVYVFAHQWLFFLPLMPAAVTTLIASYSVIGEKQQKTLEPLLSTPLGEIDLLLGNALAAPALVGTYLATIVYTAAVVYLTYPILGFAVFPNAYWASIAFLMTPAVGLLGTVVCLVISSKATDVRSAQQIGALAVMPAILFLFLQMSGFVGFNYVLVAGLSIALFLLDGWLFLVAKEVFERENILTRWK
ncbi:MAG: ABC transporter permease subunit [Thermoproteota archaeon]